MVSLDAVLASNGRIATELPAGLVAVFVGATSGIGETSLKHFVKHAKQPRIYFTGRSDAAAERIKPELKSLNPDGEYIFLKYDTSLLKNVDQACRDIKDKESTINLLFISAGTLVTGTKTQEGLHFFAALTYYSRVRFILNLLPLIQGASSLRRVVSVFAGSKEGQMFTDDFQGNKISMSSGRGHFTSMITLSLEAIARDAPSVSFIHNYPGFVETSLGRDAKGPAMAVAKVVFKVIGPFVNTPLDEVGERHTFFSTSARFPPASGEPRADGVSLDNTVKVATSTDGKTGGGVYSIDHKGESCDRKALELLAGYRRNGSMDKLWKHTQDEFVRITQKLSI
ncbi:hydrogenase/reductase-like protein [Hypoxylon sp. FL0890]|nr:hydrogenase/reductase-like protein [Hypoxylon sp. FL0890]